MLLLGATILHSVVSSVGSVAPAGGPPTRLRRAIASSVGAGSNDPAGITRECTHKSRVTLNGKCLPCPMANARRAAQGGLLSGSSEELELVAELPSQAVCAFATAFWLVKAGFRERIHYDHT